MKIHEVDLAIIGAGPAGMAAAISAKKAGLENILLLERAEYPGGLLHQCTSNHIMYSSAGSTVPAMPWRASSARCARSRVSGTTAS